MENADQNETGYKIEELLELVAKLANQYVSGESNSVSYETAEKLMDAIIYTIHSQKQSVSDTDVMSKFPTARKAYEAGNKLLKEKVIQIMERYNKMAEDFDDFQNHCLKDTVIKGMPEFFKWYDVKFDPQNTLLTLDYPILKDVSQLEGIWKIEAYLSCIELEQFFLCKLNREMVLTILSGYNANHSQMIDNLCEIVYQDVLCHLLADKPMQENISLKEKMRIIHENDITKEQLQDLSETFLKTYYENEDLISYLSPVVDGLIARMKL